MFVDINILLRDINSGQYSARFRKVVDDQGDLTVEPPGCDLPPRIPGTLELNDDPLPTVDKSCLQPFIPTPIVPLPYVDVVIPGLECPEGIAFNGGVEILVNGSSVGQEAISITPSDICEYDINGLINIELDDILCAEGLEGLNTTFSLQYSAKIVPPPPSVPPEGYQDFVNTTTTTTSTTTRPSAAFTSAVSEAGEACEWNLDLEGIIPYVPCPDGFEINTSQFYVKVIDPNTQTEEIFAPVANTSANRLTTDVPKMFFAGGANNSFCTSKDEPLTGQKAGVLWPGSILANEHVITGIAHNGIRSNGFSDTDNLLMFSASNGLFKQQHGETSWTEVMSGNLIGVVYCKKLKVWATATSSHVMRTIPGPTLSWETVATTGLTSAKIASNGQHICLAGSSSGTLKTRRWNQDGTFAEGVFKDIDGEEITLSAVTISNLTSCGGRFYLLGSVGGNALILTSGDGISWKQRNIPTGATIAEAVATCSGTTFFSMRAAGNSILYRLNDIGNTATYTEVALGATTPLSVTYAMHADDASMLVMAGIGDGETSDLRYYDLETETFGSGVSSNGVANFTALNFRPGFSQPSVDECELSLYPPTVIELPKVFCQDGINIITRNTGNTGYTFDVKNKGESVLDGGKSETTGPLRFVQNECNFELKGALELDIDTGDEPAETYFPFKIYVDQDAVLRVRGGMVFSIHSAPIDVAGTDNLTPDV